MNIVKASYGKALELKGGASLRIINTYGTQVVDLWAWNKINLNEYLSVEATRVWSQKFPGDTCSRNKTW